MKNVAGIDMWRDRMLKGLFLQRIREEIDFLVQRNNEVKVDSEEVSVYKRGISMECA